MAKLTALIFLLVAALAVANAAAHTTVVTTMMRDATCERELKQKMPMTYCKMWLMERQRGQGPCKDEFLRSAVANRRFQKERHLQECCEELNRLSSDECRCDAVWEMMMEAPLQYDACKLSQKCGFSGCSCPGRRVGA